MVPELDSKDYGSRTGTVILTVIVLELEPEQYFQRFMILELELKNNKLVLEQH